MRQIALRHPGFVSFVHCTPRPTHCSSEHIRVHLPCIWMGLSEIVVPQAGKETLVLVRKVYNVHGAGAFDQSHLISFTSSQIPLSYSQPWMLASISKIPSSQTFFKLSTEEMLSSCGLVQQGQITSSQSFDLKTMKLNWFKGRMSQFLATLYLPLWVDECHFRIWSTRVT